MRVAEDLSQYIRAAHSPSEHARRVLSPGHQNPTAQAAAVPPHDVASPSTTCVPAGQGAGSEVAAEQKWPAAHGTPLVEPAGQYEPAEQRVHDVALEPTSSLP